MTADDARDESTSFDADPYELSRFVRAQAPVYETVVAELTAGEKRTHWMWFVFPQLAGLGFSDMTRRYALRDVAEATAYLHHPLLGPRLIECIRLVVAVDGAPLAEILAPPDDLKFHSSMTLFAQVDGHAAVLDRALERYFGGELDTRTLSLLPGR